MTIDALAALDAAVHADDWDACDAWASARYDDAELGVAASAVGEALERDRARRASSLEEGTGDGLTSPQRRLFEGIVRLWRVGCAGGAVREVEADRDAAYGVLVDAQRPVLLAVSCARATIVAADATDATSRRAARQLFRVLGALAYTTSDAAGLGRSFDLAIGSIAPVSLLAGTAPGLASRWHVDAPEQLAPWLAGEGAVSVRPAGGRLALAPYVVQLEQSVERLVAAQRLAAHGALPPRGADSPDAFDPILDKRDLLLAWGWTPELEPLRPVTADVLALLDAGASAAAIHERARDEVARGR